MNINKLKFYEGTLSFTIPIELHPFPKVHDNEHVDLHHTSQTVANSYLVVPIKPNCPTY